MSAMTTMSAAFCVKAPVASKASAKVAYGAPVKAFKASAFTVKSAKRVGVVAMSAATDDIIEKMKVLTLLEASELVAQIEEVFGVDASAPAGGMMMAGPAAAVEAPVEQTEFNLVITDVDASKRIAIIKIVRSLTSLGLKEAKDAVTTLPFTILEGKTKGECEEASKTLAEGGATCEMK
jgi:large subunit ribosomal protein L7/L12